MTTDEVWDRSRDQHVDLKVEARPCDLVTFLVVTGVRSRGISVVF